MVPSWHESPVTSTNSFRMNTYKSLSNQTTLTLFRINRVEKSLHLCLAGLRIRWFDPIAESSELPKHLRSAELLRSFGDRWAPFFVTDSLVQDQPNQPALSMGDGSDSLIVSQGRKITALVLGWVEDSVVRSDSRVFGVAEASSKCGVASIVWLPLGPVLRNGLPCA